jgi:deazaflavin-dependent oxidoreductase (nitroreductase family)
MASQSANSIAAVAARIASVLGPRVMRIIARFNRHVTNPIQKLWAPHLRHMAVIEHRGRKSGRGYKTPVMAFVEDGHISVVLNYGAKSDWVRNIEAAGWASVVHQGKRYRLTDLRVIGVESPELPVGIRTLGALSRRALYATMTPA